jgi:hypothetical protein
MIFELRMYHIQPGQREAYGKWFEEEVIASQVAKGVVIVGSFVGLQDEDQFVWIRRFDSEEARERFNQEYYASEHWKNTLEPRVQEFMVWEKMQVIELRPTPMSVIH